MSAALTPLRALEALLAECEKTLDYRPDFRAAMSNAHAAIVNARAPSEDDEPTWGDLFGEPDPSAFNPQVLAVARAMVEPSEAAHA